MDNKIRKHTIDISEAPEDWQPQWIIENIWQQHSVNFFAGPPKRARKSSLRRYFTACALTGEPAFGKFKTNQVGRILTMLGEDKPGAERAAISKAVMAMGYDPAILTNRLKYCSIFDFDLRSARDVEQLVVYARDEDIDFIQLDPFVEFHFADENSANEIAAVGRNLRAVARYVGLALTHHTTKPPSTIEFGQYNPRTLGEQMRGSGVLGGISDCTVGSMPVGDAKHRVRLSFEIKVPPESGEPDPFEVEIDQQTWVWALADPLEEQTIISYVSENPGCKKMEVYKALGRKWNKASAIIDDMVTAGRLLYEAPEGGKKGLYVP